MSFPESPSICPVLSLKDYLVRTAPLHAVDAQHMFIQLRQPHKSVSSQTLACQITNMMADAGVDTSSFHQHSTRSASAAWLGSGTNKKMSVAQICHQGQWSRSTTTFRKFYHKIVLHTECRQRSSKQVGRVEVGMVKPTILPDLKSQSGNKVSKIIIVCLDTQGVLSYIPISGELFPWG